MNRLNKKNSKKIKFNFRSNQFVLGHIVDGKITITTKHPISATSISIAYLCLETINDTANETEQKTIHQSTTILKQSKEPFQIENNDEFAFHISIPIDLPPSIQSELITVEHLFKVDIVKAGVNALFMKKKKIHSEYVLNMYYPHINGLLYYTKRNIFEKDGYQLSVFVESDIYSLGQNMRIHVELDGKIERDVQIPLTMKLIRKYSRNAKCIKTEINQHEDTMRLNQPLQLEMKIPSFECPTIKLPLSDVSVEYYLYVIAEMVSLTSKSNYTITGKIPIFITDMQNYPLKEQVKMGNEIPIQQQRNDHLEEECKAIMNEFDMVLQTLLNMKLFDDSIITDCPERRKYSIKDYNNFVSETLSNILIINNNEATWRNEDNNPNYPSIRKLTRKLQIVVNNILNGIMMVQHSPLRTSLFMNCFLMLQHYQKVLFAIYMKKQSIQTDITKLNETIIHFLEYFDEATQNEGFIELGKFRKWLLRLQPEVIPSKQGFTEEELMKQLNEAVRKTTTCIYKIRLACDTHEFEHISDLLENTQQQILDHASILRSLLDYKYPDCGQVERQKVRTDLITFANRFESFIERSQIVSYHPQYRTQKYFDYIKVFVSLWDVNSVILLDQKPVYDGFDILQCTIENNKLVVRDIYGEIIENPSVYTKYQEELEYTCELCFNQLKDTYKKLMIKHNHHEFFDSFQQLITLLNITYLHPNVYSKFMKFYEIEQKDVNFVEAMKELFVRMEKFIGKLKSFYKMDVSRNITPIIQDTCHALNKVTQQLLLVLQLSLLHGQVYSHVYTQLIDEYKKFRKLVHQLIINEFDRILEHYKQYHKDFNPIQADASIAEMKNLIYYVLFEDYVNSSDTIDTHKDLSFISEDDDYSSSSESSFDSNSSDFSSISLDSE